MAEDTTPGALSGPGEREGSPWLPEHDRYVPIGRIGSGGMGEVWRVRDRRLERTLAMKLIHPWLAADMEVRARFRDEVRLTAGLAHPAIVVVFDTGEDERGRAWYTMQEVERARSLREVLVTTPGALPENLRILGSVADAVAYAHGRGVLHRDLKPGNILTGAFDQVLVLDWGLARRVGASADPEERGVDVATGGTTVGRVFGSPPYCPPEQALGRPEAHCTASDVYSLGAILHELLTGAPPFGTAAGMAVAFAAGRGAPPVRPQVADDLQSVAALADAALDLEPSRRPNAHTFAGQLRAWREETDRRGRSRAAIARADRLIPELEHHREQARLLREQSLRHVVPPHAPEEQKWPIWDLEDAASAAERAAIDLDIRTEQALRAALDHAPDDEGAHARLADQYRARLERAEQAADAEGAARWEALVRTHDRGRHARWLAGDGALTLHTDPPASAELFRVVERGRQRVLEPAGSLGDTPLDSVPIRPGSWVVRLQAPDRLAVDYPVFIGRCSHWNGVPPGRVASAPVRLPKLGELERNDCYVPGGWCQIGGDPLATDALPGAWRWIDPFVIRRFPVTVEEYAVFLEHIARDSIQDALRMAPTQTAGAVFHRPLLAPDPSGRFVPMPDPDGVTWGTRWPVTLVDWDACVAFAGWEAARTGVPWRLPHELEWEKAARGVDGRTLPWGDHFEPTWANTPVSRPDTASRADVDLFPKDVSIYGVRGMVGNVRDRCANLYSRLGDVEHSVTGDATNRGLRVTRGGAWLASLPLCRPAGRFADPPERRMSAVGFRLVRSV